MAKVRLIDKVPPDLVGEVSEVTEIVSAFADACLPLERSRLYIMVDARTGARYCECHVKARKLVELGTTDVPLDPDEQAEYRANREIVLDHVAFERMKDDAKQRRTFSNIVAEYTTSFDPEHPFKVIGGQHRFDAIKEGLEDKVNEYHGVKVYFDLTKEQRLDVQLISNTNIAASSDLFDRMQETQAGPELRDWCHECGLLESGKDFADRKKTGSAITVRAVRTFILNYYLGRELRGSDFGKVHTTPSTVKTGQDDPEWNKVRSQSPSIWKDEKLTTAGKEFAALIAAQQAAFAGKPGSSDSETKALNSAVMSAWAFVAGLLQENPVRLKRHFALKSAKGKDPLNAAALAKGKHKTDPENYRGLGYRVDAKERGRLVELFNLQAEKGDGIAPALVDLAIKQFHAKAAILEVEAAKQKA
jgi:hypothetical protein